MTSTNASQKQQSILQKAIALQESGQLVEAIHIYKKLLKLSPKDPQLLNTLGMIALQLDNFKEGLNWLEQSLKISPNQPYTLSNCGFALQELKRYKTALAYHDRALALQPNYVDAHYNRGLVLQALKCFEEALLSFDTTIALHPNDADAYYNRSISLKELKRYDDALISIDKVIALQPDYADAHCNRGTVLTALKRYNDALESYDKAITFKPNYHEAYSNRGNALFYLHHLKDALASIDHAIALNPDYAESHYNRGTILHLLKRYEDALISLNQAIKLNPNYAEAYSNRGNTLQKLNQLDKALTNHDRAINLKPHYANAHLHRGIILYEFKRLDEAMASYDRAIALKPDHADAYWNKALLKLLTGEYEEGWKLYEWRWKHNDQEHFRSFPQPLWLGEEPAHEKTLLIHTEQGLGDIIQFCRYALMAKTHFTKVILEVPKDLAALIASLKGDFTLVEKGKSLPHFDLQCPIMSLPLAFKTTLETISTLTPYLFSSAVKQHIWHKKIGNKTKPRIGLAWSGSSGHKNDHNRSLLLKHLDLILQLPFEFHSLQKEIRLEDMETLTLFKHIHLHQDELIDFSDTAALINEMDLVISVDTSIAHLAGALNKTVWILLSFMPDYRWMLDRADSPWYPTATLYRQPKINDWESVIDEVKNNLLEML